MLSAMTPVYAVDGSCINMHGFRSMKNVGTLKRQNCGGSRPRGRAGRSLPVYGLDVLREWCRRHEGQEAANRGRGRRRPAHWAEIATAEWLITARQSVLE